MIIKDSSSKNKLRVSLRGNPRNEAGTVQESTQQSNGQWVKVQWDGDIGALTYRPESLLPHWLQQGDVLAVPLSEELAVGATRGYLVDAFCISPGASGRVYVVNGWGQGEQKPLDELHQYPFAKEDVLRGRARRHDKQ